VSPDRGRAVTLVVAPQDKGVLLDGAAGGRERVEDHELRVLLELGEGAGHG